MRRPLLATLSWLALYGLAVAEPGLIVNYPFEEGWGQTAWDYSGGGHNGVIRNGSWTESEGRPALVFNGRDTEVDCGTAADTNPTGAITVEAWVYPDGVPGYGEPGVVGKDYSSYLLTYYHDGHFWWYGGGTRCRAPAAANLWHHVVGTFDGKWLRLYVDAVPVDSMAAQRPTLNPGKTLFLGCSAGNPQFTKGAHFKGMLCEVRVYSRALSAEEVARQYRSTRLTGQVAVRPQMLVFAGTLTAELDSRGLGLLPPGSRLAVELRKAGSPAAVETRDVPVGPSCDPVEVSFQAGRLAPGPYRLTVRATGPDGKSLVTPSEMPLQWPQRPQWKTAPQAKVLNNLVTELLRDEKRASHALANQYSFVNPREGWVFMAWTVRPGVRGSALALDGRPVATHGGSGIREAMRYLRAGPHQIEVQGATELERLVVRAIPELGYANYDSSPLVAEFGPYDWQFLAKHVLPNVNLLISSGYGSKPDETRLFIAQWKADGKRWLMQCGVPGLGAKTPVGAAECQKYWASHVGMTDPLVDGLIVDEFGGGEDPRYLAWTEAVGRLHVQPNLGAKLFYPYCSPMYAAEASRRFTQAVFAAGGRVAFERYLPEQPTERAARSCLGSMLAGPIGEWSQAMPGAAARLIATVGVFSQPPESLDVNPAVNHKVFLDMQLCQLANDPRTFGLGGVMTYLASYSDEETVRWMGRLLRHYCIEGRAERLSRDPYLLPHLENGDFEQGLAGWTVAASEPGSVTARTVPGLSWLEGRYPQTRQGDTALALKRNRHKPNEVSQTIKALEPGRLYSLRLYSADGQDMSRQAKHALAVQVEGGEVLPEKSFQHVFANCYSHHWGPYDASHRAWLNYHWILFRAKTSQATLRITDWLTPKDAGGPAGQELLVNFVQVQPYDP